MAAGGERLAAVDIAAGKHPLAVARLDRAPHEHEPTARRLDDRPDRDLRVDVEDEAAARADGALRLGGFQQTPFERTAASRAELIGVRFVVRMEMDMKRSWLLVRVADVVRLRVTHLRSRTPQQVALHRRTV